MHINCKLFSPVIRAFEDVDIVRWALRNCPGLYNAHVGYTISNLKYSLGRK